MSAWHGNVGKLQLLNLVESEAAKHGLEVAIDVVERRDVAVHGAHLGHGRPSPPRGRLCRYLAAATPTNGARRRLQSGSEANQPSIVRDKKFKGKGFNLVCDLLLSFVLFQCTKPDSTN